MGPGIAILAAGGLTAVARVVNGRKPEPAIFAGAVIGGAALLAIAQVSPELASRFGTLVVITALLTAGADVATGASRVLGA